MIKSLQGHKIWVEWKEEEKVSVFNEHHKNLNNMEALFQKAKGMYLWTACESKLSKKETTQRSMAETL